MSEIQRFRKRPVVVEAIQIEAEVSETEFLDPNTRSHAVIAEWMLSYGFKNFAVHGEHRPYGLAIGPLKDMGLPLGDMRLAEPGDWIVRDGHGEFYPVKPDVFEACYDPA